MEIVIALIIAVCVWFNKFLEDQKTKDMTPDQRWKYEWDKLEKKYKFGKHDKKK